MSTLDPLPAFAPPPSAACIEATIGLIERLCAISSATGDRAGIGRAVDTLAEALRGVGLETAVATAVGADGEAPVLHAATPGRLGDGTLDGLVLVGHLDTVLPAWTPRRDDRRLWASGAADMKGGLATLVGALAHLRDHGLAPPADLRLVVTPDEEILGPISYQTMHAAGDAARGLWVLEPGKADGDDGETIVGRRRGMLHWQLDVRGRSAHAGNALHAGRSALLAAARWATAVHDLNRGGEAPTINPGRMVAGEALFVDHLADHHALVGTTAQINAVPNRARIEGEARFLRRADADALLDRLQDLTADTARRHEVAAAFRATPPVPPLEPHPDGARWADRAIASAANAGWRLVVESSRGGLSFPNFLPDPAALPVLDGLGPWGDGLHARREFVDLRSVARRVGLLANLLAAEANAPIDSSLASAGSRRALP